MSESSNSPLLITLRSGRVISRVPREVSSRRRRRTESAPHIIDTQEFPEVPPPQEATMAEEGLHGPEEELPLSHYSCPSLLNAPSCIVPPQPTINYEIKPSVLAILPTFRGKTDEQPYSHIMEFEEVSSTMRLGHLTFESLKLRLFPFTLKDKARAWFHKLRPQSIITWADMQKIFLNAYYPHSRTTTMRDRLTKFYQEEHESFYESWERFKARH